MIKILIAAISQAQLTKKMEELKQNIGINVLKEEKLLNSHHIIHYSNLMYYGMIWDDLRGMRFDKAYISEMLTIAELNKIKILLTNSPFPKDEIINYF